MRDGSSTHKARIRRAATLLLGVTVTCTGCDTIRSMMPAAREAAEAQEKLTQLQARAMRFSDGYVGRVVEESSRFRRQFEDPDLRYILSGWMLTQANAAYSNAAGPSPVVNALDLVTLATLSRMVVEDTLVPRFSEAGKAMLETHRQLETQAWTMCEEFLTPSQIAEFRSVLDEWRVQNPRVSSVAFIHFLDFAKQIGRPRPGESARSGGLFAMLGIDPLAGLDPAIQQIEQTRQLAERTIFYLQRMPYVMNLQFERLGSDLFARPETRAALDDADRISRSVERFSLVAAGLPAQISAEREALIRQLSMELVSQEQALQPLLVELRDTLDAGNTTAQSLDAMIRSVDTFMARFPSKPPGTSPDESSGRPFDITEYTAAAAEFSRTASQLRDLVTALDAQAPQLAGTIDGAVSRGQSLIDYLFVRLAALLVLLVATVLGAALIWRRFARAPARASGAG
jgi:hypothetical protein